MAQTRDFIQIHELARQMARSGRFCSWRLIAIELRFMEGVREADYAFSHSAFREELDGLCRTAQKVARPKLEPAREARPSQPAATSVPAVPRFPLTPDPLRSDPLRSDLPQSAPPPPDTSRSHSPPGEPLRPETLKPETLRPETPVATAPPVPSRRRAATLLGPAPRWVPKYRS